MPWEEVLSIVVAAATVLALACSVISIYMSEKMIQASTRPYLTVEYSVGLPINPSRKPDRSHQGDEPVGIYVFRLVVKNRGQSPAQILDVSHEELPDNILNLEIFERGISSLRGTILSPGQSVLIGVTIESKDSSHNSFALDYRQVGIIRRRYHDKFDVNFNLPKEFAPTHYLHDSMNEKEAMVIKLLQEMIDRIAKL